MVIDKNYFSSYMYINMFEQELDNLLQKNWSDEERRLISLLMENIIYYKKLIPKSLKQRRTKRNDFLITQNF